MIEGVKRVKLVATKDSFGGYVVYVFENLDSKSYLDKYMMCTRFPNWQCQTVTINDTGYVKYREVQAGKDVWYDMNIDKWISYKYTGTHFLDFVKEKEPKKDLIL
jgi:hypothetical protein